MNLFKKTALLIWSIFLVLTITATIVLYIDENKRIEEERLSKADNLHQAIYKVLYADFRQGGDRQSHQTTIDHFLLIEGTRQLKLIQGQPLALQFGYDPARQPKNDLEKQALNGEPYHEVRLEGGIRVMRQITPIFAEASCQACHPVESGEVIGALSSQIALETFDQALLARRNARLGWVIAGLLGFGLITFISIQQVIVWPLQRLINGAQGFINQGATVQSPTTKGNEILSLARTFYDLAVRLRESNERLENLVQERTESLSALNAMLTAISASLDLDEVFRAFTKEIRKIVNFDLLSITVFKPDHRAETTPLMISGEEVEIGTSFLGKRTPLMEWIIAQKRPCIDSGLLRSSEGEPDHWRLRVEGMRTRMLVPIIFREEVIGTINFASRQRDLYTEADGERLIPFAAQLGVALENARLYEETKHLSLTDELTGLANHRAFDTRLAEEILRAQRYQHPLALIMADIDHFKHYNDAHGHPQGDILLHQLAEVLKSGVRETDFVARYGGEEFAIILPETEKFGALTVAKKIQMGIASHAFPLEESQPGGRLTLSLGLAAYPEDMSNPSDLIQKADQALYRAKQSGRNQICSL
jgi:diguanylate cyclase (GGDEF)-like protein